MLLFRTYVSPSRIHGLGVFAGEPIPARALIWRFEPSFDKLIREADLAAMPEHVVSYVRTYAEFFPDLGGFVLSSDNDRFMNHSCKPNTRSFGTTLVAARDIAKGEELTVDYCQTNILHDIAA